MRYWPSFIFMAIFLHGCGRTEQKIELKNALIDDANDPNCKRGKCPQVEYSVTDSSGIDLAQKTFEGIVSSNVEWAVKVKSQTPNGRIKIALKIRPNWVKSKATGSAGSIIIFGTPENTTEMNTITLVARDIARCAALETDTKQCSNSKVDFKDYDKVFTLKFAIRSTSPGPGQP